MTRTLAPARLDLVARLMTVSFALATVTGFVLALVGPAAIALVAVLLTVIGVGCLAVAPRSYVLDGSGLTIHRRLGSLHVAGPLVAEAVPARALLGSKLVGSGGLFGYLGLYRAPGGGTCPAAVTARDRAVLVRGASRRVLVSPDDPRALLEAVSADA